MMKIATGALAGAAALMVALSAPAMAAGVGKADVASPASAVEAAKSCGTYMYPDKKTRKCVDARNKKK